MDRESPAGSRKRSHSPVPSAGPNKRSHSPVPPNNPMKEDWIQKANGQAREIFGKNARGYEQVLFLGLHWEDEHAGFKKEVEELALFFETAFHFTAKLFAIPTERGSAKLNAEIANLVNEFSGPKKLLIVYYGGHGFENNEAQAIWVRGQSHSREGAVHWYKTQELLFESMGDIVVIIDACYSADAGRRSTSDNKKIELLASSSMGCKSPGPGADSYTTKLIKTMKDLLKKEGQFSISTLNSYLERARVGLQQTPHYSDLTANDHKSIVLRPLNSGICSLGSNTGESQIYLNILFGLSEEPSESLISVLMGWFDKSAPKELTDCILVDFFTKISFGKTLDSPLETLSIKALQKTQEQHSENQLAKEVLQRWLNHIKMKPRADKPTTFRVPSQDQLVLESVPASPVSVSSSMEICQDELSLLVAGTIMFDSAVGGENISASGMRCNPFNGTETLENRQPRTLFSYGNLNGGRVLVEYRDYPVQQDIELEFEKQIRKEVVSQVGTKLCIPHCVGYIKDSEQKRFGLVYNIPHEASSHTTLYDEICNKRLISFEHRLKLARTMARTAWHFQGIGWYHGSINSKNVFFFNNDYSQPYLFGIGAYAYRCQGSLLASGGELGTWPSTGFMYDGVCVIRDLGSLLLDVGLWGPEELFITSRENTTPPATKSQLTQTFEEKLEHSMGADYREATAICFRGSNQATSASDLFKRVHQLLDRDLR